MSKLLAAAGADGESQSLSEKYCVDHFDTLTGFGITFEKSKKYKEVADMADVDIVKMPGQTALDLEDMIRRGGLLIPDAEENFFQKEGFDPIARYDDIYLIGTYLSACINSNLANDVYFPHITRLAETLEDWFSKILDEDLQKNSELVNRMRQALPILFFNLYYISKKNGDTISATNWINSAQVASYRLGTRQFAFYTTSEKARLIAEAIVFSDDLTIFDTDQFFDVITEMQRMEGLANSWYRARIAEKSGDLVLEKRIIKNQNKSTLARLGYEGARLLGQKVDMATMGINLTNRGVEIERILKPDNAQKLQSLIAYEKKVRVIKGEFMKFYDNRDTEAFENTDMHMIVLCEMMIARMARQLKQNGATAAELSPVQSYLDPGFWKPVEDIPESLGVADATHPDRSGQSMERSIMHMNPDLDQRYHRMAVFNLLMNEGTIMILPGGNFNPLGRSILGKIARDISGLNPYISATLSKYFTDAKDHPVVKEFLDNIAKLGVIGENGMRIDNSRLYDVIIDGSEYYVSTIGKYMQRILLGLSGYNNYRDYFDRCYGYGKWYLEYTNPQISSDGSKRKPVTIGNSDLKVNSSSNILIQGESGITITIYHTHPNQELMPMDILSPQRQLWLSLPLERMSDSSKNGSNDDAEDPVKIDTSGRDKQEVDRKKLKILQICREILQDIDKLNSYSLNLDMVASPYISMKDGERADLAPVLYQILGTERLKGPTRSLATAILMSGISTEAERRIIDGEVRDSILLLQGIRDGTCPKAILDSLKGQDMDGGKDEIKDEIKRQNMIGLLEILQKRIVNKLQKLQALQKALEVYIPSNS